MTSGAIRHILTSDPAVSARVGGRVYSKQAPQGKKKPYIVYLLVSVTPSNTKEAPSKLDRQRWQIDIYGDSDYGAQQLAADVRAALDYRSGVIQGADIKQIRFLSHNGDFVEKSRTPRESMDFIIRVNNP